MVQRASRRPGCASGSQDRKNTNAREGREKAREREGKGARGRVEERVKEGDGEEEEQEVGKRRWKSGEQRLARLRVGLITKHD